MSTKPALLCATLVVLAGCSATVQGTPSATDQPTEAPSFDLAAVKASFQAECEDPIVVDANFCEQVQLPKMTADGTILNVPTSLNEAATDRARAICQMIATAHFDGATGADLGYDTIGILDKDGGHAAACTI